MPKEVTDLLIDGLTEVKVQIQEMRKEMHEEHKALTERVVRLEHQERITRWLFAAGGALIMLTARELIPRFFM